MDTTVCVCSQVDELMMDLNLGAFHESKMSNIAELPGALGLPGPPGPLSGPLDPTPQYRAQTLDGDAFDATLSVTFCNHPSPTHTQFSIRIYAIAPLT